MNDRNTSETSRAIDEHPDDEPAGSSPPGVAEETPPTSADAESGWYYVHRGVPRGPISQQELEDLFLEGVLEPKSLVKGPGTPRWQPARDVPGLAVEAAEAEPTALADRNIGLQAQGQPVKVLEELELLETVLAPPHPAELGERPSGEDDSEEAVVPVDETADDLVADDLAADETVADLAADADRVTQEASEPESAPATAEQTDPSTIDDVLGALAEQRGRTLEHQRRLAIDAASRRYRFDEINNELLKPQLKELMARLHEEGYPTRLREIDRLRVRFDFTVDHAPLVRCTLKVTYREATGEVVFEFLRDMIAIGMEPVPLEEVDAEVVSEKIASFVRRCLQLR